ncbi:hypothetical protein [Rubrivirga sp.]
MPAISFFYGLVVYPYFFDEGQHHELHVRVKYQGEEAVCGSPTAR